MDEITFKPDYGLNNVLGIAFMLLLGVLFLYLGYKDDSIAMVGGGGFMALLGFFSVLAYPKKILFTPNQVLVKKLLLPDQVFEYQEFTDIGGTGIRFGRRGISLLNMNNGDELISIFKKLIEERKIQSSQFQGKLAVEEALTSKAMKYSIIPGLILSFIVNILLDTYFDIHLDGRLVSGTVIIITLLIVYYFLKNKQEME